MSPSHAYSAAQSKLIAPGHGKVGYVDLRVTVAPEVKDALIELAIRNGTWVMEEVREALDSYILKSRTPGSLPQETPGVQTAKESR